MVNKIILIVTLVVLSGTVMAQRCKFYKPAKPLPQGCSWACINGEWVSMCK